MRMPPVVYRDSCALLVNVLLAAALLLLTACASKPLNPWTTDDPPLALVPVADAGVDDQRGRFREIYCEVLESRGENWPDYRPCEQALTRVAGEPAGSGEPVDLGVSEQKYLALIVPGVGWECIEEWLKLDESISELLESFGFQRELLKVDGLSGTEHNAHQIRDAIAGLPEELDNTPIVLIGYSKGAPDILQAVVDY